jgi:hypothetical protein
MINDLEEANKRIAWYEKKYGPYIENRGLGNWKNLFKRPSMNDWIVLVLLIMAIGLAFAYQHDTEVCRSYLANQTSYIALGGQNMPNLPIYTNNITG